MKELPDATPEGDLLSRRERQLMDVVYRRGRVTAREVLEEVADGSAYSTVRTLLGVLVRKKWLRTKKEGRALVYEAAKKPAAVGQSALRRVVRTFFQGSVVNAVSGLLGMRQQPLEAEEVERLERMIHEAKKESRR